MGTLGQSRKFAFGPRRNTVWFKRSERKLGDGGGGTEAEENDGMWEHPAGASPCSIRQIHT